ncbi:glycosyltransferase family 2 protein [Halorubrum aethiopicum]|uniref:glycosyltransferase family 2 protein n=1 Tax=Halorubrum aethiopicum TaxID=1758255 RepID=UPI00082B5049|nr:glycosyltransferase [Halorubrum aethiopicum]
MYSRGVITWEVIAVLSLIAVAVLGLALFLPPELLVLVVAVAAMATVYFSGAVYLLARPAWIPARFDGLPVVLGVGFPLVVVAVVGYHYRALLTPVAVVFALGLLFVFLYYWLVVPLALFQKIRNANAAPEPAEWPPLTVLVPAYNEEYYVGDCLRSVQTSRYPGPLSIVVIDDGSTDGTYAEASAAAADGTRVIRTENGGKHAALNRGLEHVKTDLVVSVDADSTLHPDALAELVRDFGRHENVGAIAGNVKVVNRGSLVTNLQALEYVVGINTFRRAFDLFGAVTVVPGSLGAFRRDVLEEVRGYSADTVTEDFDLTIAILKRGYAIHASEAIVYTEAPDTWRDLYAQRRRWFQGNLQTVVKHREVFADGRYGILHRVAFPYVFLSMSALPLLGVLVLALIVFSLFAGGTGLLLQLAGFFVLLQVLLSALAVLIEGEDLRLVVLAPFSLFGYKQFQDAVLLRSLGALRPGRDDEWLKPTRARQRAIGPSAAVEETDAPLAPEREPNAPSAMKK